MSNIVPFQGSRELAFEPKSIQEAMELCQYLIKSRFLPESIKTPEQALAIMVTGRELGLSTMQSLRTIHVIKGKPTMSADLMVALSKRHPDCEYFRCLESTNQVATYETKRKGSEAVQRSFTMRQAQTAQLTGNPTWKKFPEAMLRARAKSDLARDEYPDIVMGIYDPDELQDTQPPPAPEKHSSVTEKITENLSSKPEKEEAPIIEGEAEEIQEEDGPDLSEEIRIECMNKIECSDSIGELNTVVAEIKRYLKAKQLPESARGPLLKAYQTRKVAIQGNKTDQMMKTLSGEEPGPSNEVDELIERIKACDNTEGLMQAFESGEEIIRKTPDRKGEILSEIAKKEKEFGM